MPVIFAKKLKSSDRLETIQVPLLDGILFLIRIWAISAADELWKEETKSTTSYFLWASSLNLKFTTTTTATMPPDDDYLSYSPSLHQRPHTHALAHTFTFSLGAITQMLSSPIPTPLGRFLLINKDSKWCFVAEGATVVQPQPQTKTTFFEATLLRRQQQPRPTQRLRPRQQQQDEKAIFAGFSSKLILCRERNEAGVLQSLTDWSAERNFIIFLNYVGAESTLCNDRYEIFRLQKEISKGIQVRSNFWKVLFTVNHNVDSLAESDMIFLLVQLWCEEVRREGKPGIDSI